MDVCYEISSPGILSKIASGETDMADIVCKDHHLTVKKATGFVNAVNQSKALTYFAIYFETQENGALKTILDALKDCPKFEYLLFDCRVRLTVEDIQAVADIIDHKGLNSLMLNSPDVRLDPIFIVLTQNKRLVDLNLSHCNLGQESLAFLVNAIEHNRHLNCLSLTTNELGDEAISLIANSLMKNTPHSITELNLGCNKFSLQGMMALTPYLIKPGVKITKLDLSCCRLGDTSAPYLASIIKNNRTLRHLDIENNGFTTQGLIQIVEAIQFNDSITILNIGPQASRGAGALNAPIEMVSLPAKLSKLLQTADKKMALNETAQANHSNDKLVTKG
jgi:Ran GTPase-activating protein (RanGAP) involved in mRNA processing and transport